MDRRNIALIAVGALFAYAFCRQRGGRPIPTDVIAMDEPVLFQWVARGGF